MDFSNVGSFYKGWNEAEDRFRSTRLDNMRLWEEFKRNNPDATMADLQAFRNELSSGDMFAEGYLPADQALQALAQKNAERAIAAKEAQDFERLTRTTNMRDSLAKSLMDIAPTAANPMDAYSKLVDNLPPEMKTKVSSLLPADMAQGYFNRAVNDAAWNLATRAHTLGMNPAQAAKAEGFQYSSAVIESAQKAWEAQKRKDDVEIGLRQSEIAQRGLALKLSQFELNPESGLNRKFWDGTGIDPDVGARTAQNRLVDLHTQKALNSPEVSGLVAMAQYNGGTEGDLAAAIERYVNSGAVPDSVRAQVKEGVLNSAKVGAQKQFVEGLSRDYQTRLGSYEKQRPDLLKITERNLKSAAAQVAAEFTTDKNRMSRGADILEGVLSEYDVPAEKIATILRNSGVGDTINTDKYSAEEIKSAIHTALISEGYRPSPLSSRLDAAYAPKMPNFVQTAKIPDQVRADLANGVKLYDGYLKDLEANTKRMGEISNSSPEWKKLADANAEKLLLMKNLVSSEFGPVANISSYLQVYKNRPDISMDPSFVQKATSDLQRFAANVKEAVTKYGDPKLLSSNGVNGAANVNSIINDVNAGKNPPTTIGRVYDGVKAMQQRAVDGTRTAAIEAAKIKSQMTGTPNIVAARQLVDQLKNQGVDFGGTSGEKMFVRYLMGYEPIPDFAKSQSGR